MCTRKSVHSSHQAVCRKQWVQLGRTCVFGAGLLCVRVCVQPLWLKSPRPLFHKEWGTVNSCSSDSLPKSIEQADLGCTDTPPHRCTSPTSGLQRLSDAKASTKVCRPAQPILLLWKSKSGWAVSSSHQFLLGSALWNRISTNNPQQNHNS